MPHFGQVLTAMVTPFDDNGSVDLKAAQELAAHLLANGNDGLVLAGTTGEAPTLKTDEHVELLSAVVDAHPDAMIVAGTGSNDTSSAIALTQKAEEIGVRGILSVAPYYNRPSQAGLYGHYKAIAACTDLPVMLYDIPVRTGRKVATDTLLALAEIDNVVALKDAAGDVGETARLIASAPDGFEVYSGDDSLTLPLLAVGAVGVVGVASHWAGEEMAAMVSAYSSGDVVEAARINRSLVPSYLYESSAEAPNPVPAKALLGLQGHPVGRCRPPMDAVPPNLVDRAAEILTGLGRE